MLFLFCQPGLKDKNTVDFLIRDLIIKSLKLKKNHIVDINSLNRNSYFKQNQQANHILRYIFKIKSAIVFLYELKKILKQKEIKNIFLDSYTIFDLFFFSFLKTSKTYNVIIYLRIPYNYIPVIKYLFSFSVIKLKNKGVKFITDTEELKRHYRNKYGIKSEVMPIPSKINKKNKLKKFNIKKISILFPGKSRDEKGISNIFKLFGDEIKDIDINFFFLKNQDITDNLRNKKNLKLQTINNNLTYKNYIKSLYKYDLILLPYSHKTYKLRSSGIFLDLIKLNKIFFVSDLTWMSNILKKNNIDDLVVNNWNIVNFKTKLNKINSNFSTFKKKYIKMRKKIIQKNSDTSFDRKIKKIFLNNIKFL